MIPWYSDRATRGKLFAKPVDRFCHREDFTFFHPEVQSLLKQTLSYIVLAHLNT